MKGNFFSNLFLNMIIFAITQEFPPKIHDLPYILEVKFRSLRHLVTKRQNQLNYLLRECYCAM